jgi:hypothetical protein
MLLEAIATEAPYLAPAEPKMSLSPLASTPLLIPIFYKS